MKNVFLLFALILVAGLFQSCSDTATPTTEPTLKLYAEMTNTIVNSISRNKDEISLQANEVDSIRITSVRFLLTEIKLHPESDDLTKVKVIKTGPFVYSVYSNESLKEIVTTIVPPGNYKKIKFEFHRFSSSEISNYANDPILKDFATSNRYSTIIEGVKFNGGVPSNFSYKSDAVSNLELSFPQTLVFAQNSTTHLSIQIDPKVFFKKSGSIMDPDDPKNQNDIDNLIRLEIKAVKKNL